MDMCLNYKERIHDFIDSVKKLQVNFKEVLKNPYIDYDLCVKIFDYRDEVAELQDISELILIW